MNKSILFLAGSLFCFSVQSQVMELLPAKGQRNVNPDTHLQLVFSSKPVLNNTGKIRVFRMRDNQLIDSLDLSIPPGPVKSVDHGNQIPPYSALPYSYSSENFTNKNTKPGTPSGLAQANSDSFQLNIIGRFTDAFHFYPVIIRDNKATIYLHNNMLEYNERYYVKIDAEVFGTPEYKFEGVNNKSWNFTTRKKAPALSRRTLVVDASGKGDFNTIQGAVDFIPDYSKKTYTVLIRNGKYEEIVYFRNKSNINFRGGHRDSVIVFYANNEVFNPHPANISTNEWPGTFPSRRAAFACDNSTDIRFENFTIATTAKGQAEGLLIMGERNYLKNMHIIGSGDALQANGSVYLENCIIDGDGDTYLGRGPAYFVNCRINSKGTFMWVRNTHENHGVVLRNCELVCSLPGRETDIARAPANKGREYPYCEAVLINCKLSGIVLQGWGAVGTNTTNVHYWEYNSTDLATGKPVDMSQRHPVSRQLTLPTDSTLIRNYSSPAFILKGWNPE